ncbi:hypothetical protein F5884DRAFT_439517 [Xylogone sp. PMI_703]|nr:hypothetical protein F5884DRAFT_439517 [Xylogone sp. PMI_703]
MKRPACSSCVKFELSCIFPTHRKRPVVKRPRGVLKNKSIQMLDPEKIQRLTDILEQIDVDSLYKLKRHHSLSPGEEQPTLLGAVQSKIVRPSQPEPLIGEALHHSHLTPVAFQPSDETSHPWEECPVADSWTFSSNEDISSSVPELLTSGQFEQAQREHTILTGQNVSEFSFDLNNLKGIPLLQPESLKGDVTSESDNFRELCSISCSMELADQL